MDSRRRRGGAALAARSAWRSAAAARDPYTQLHDRATIVPERRRRDVWKTIGEPGTVLADGEIAGIWRPRKKGRSLTVTVTVFGTLSKRQRELVEHEAEAVGALRGASATTVDIEKG